jgi:long-chain fatty acid transport protein
MGGVGYAMSNVSSVDFSFTYAPEVTATNSNTGVTTTHSQTNWQLMYSQRF